MTATRYPDDARARVRAVMERRGLSCRDVAGLTQLDVRTIQRFVRGETFSLETLAIIEATLRIGSGGDATTSDSRSPMLTNPRQGPVVGWAQAAHMLGMHHNTLIRHRRRHGDKTLLPWWRSAESLARWFEAMIEREVVE